MALCSAACVGKEAWRVGVLVCYSLLSRGSLARSFSDAASAGGGRGGGVGGTLGSRALRAPAAARRRARSSKLGDPPPPAASRPRSPASWCRWWSAAGRCACQAPRGRPRHPGWWWLPWTPRSPCTCRACPSSSLMPTSSLTTWPPVGMALPCGLALRLSPSCHTRRACARVALAPRAPGAPPTRLAGRERTPREAGRTGAASLGQDAAR